MSTIALVTTCKGRLHHLKTTLPQWIEAKPDQIVVVDYGCPDGTAAWASENYPSVSLVSVNDDPGFSAARARNLGEKAVDCEWLVFVDADIEMSPGWLEHVRSNLKTGCYYIASREARKLRPDLTGTVVCETKYFDQIGGYDELYRGWGYEDTDLYARLEELAGLSRCVYQAGDLIPIPHGDEERIKFQKDFDKEINAALNRYYFEAKRKIIAITQENLGLGARKQLYSTLEAIVRRRRVFRRAAPNSLTANIEQVIEGASIVLKIANRRRYWVLGPRKIRVACEVKKHHLG